MSDKSNTFDPEKITIIDFKTVKNWIDAPEDFDAKKIEGHHLDNSLRLGFNLEEKLIKVDFTVEIKTKSKGQKSKESTGNFHFVFVYHIDNLEELAKLDEDNLVKLHPGLSNALSSVTYSTSRGVLLTKLQGTALQNFVLPVVNPNKLFRATQANGLPES